MPRVDEIATRASSLHPAFASDAVATMVTAIERRPTDGRGVHLPRNTQPLAAADFMYKTTELFDRSAASTRPSGDRLQHCAL